jgi:putative oxidoreductase
MFKRIIKTTNSYSVAVLRITLGIVLLAHGFQKAFGWFNGFGWNNSINYFTTTVGLPYILAVSTILIETLGSVLLLIGFAGRINAALMAIVIAGAFFVDHVHNGFYMNWFGIQKGEGYEFDILFWAISIALIISGSGRFSIDVWLTKRLQQTSSTNRQKEFFTAEATL